MKSKTSPGKVSIIDSDKISSNELQEGFIAFQLLEMGAPNSSMVKSYGRLKIFESYAGVLLSIRKLLDLEPPQIDLFWVVPERHHRPRSPQEGPFPGWVPVLNRKKTQMGLQGGLRKSGYF